MKAAAAVAVVVVVVVVGVVGGCTSFMFKKGGKGAAPSELQDHGEMAPIDGGSFEMGSKIAEPDEYPAHKVVVSSFLLDPTEVTLKNYARCVEALVCRAVKTQAPEGIEITDQHPVVGATWYDAKKYCEWVGKRLPTEAEWEYAARKPHWSAYPWNGPFASTKANWRDTADGFAFTAPVGSYAGGKSQSAVFDLAGNAAEWTADWYESTWYQKATPERDPKGPEAPTGSKSVRGGSWADPDHLLRSTARLSLDPNVSNNSVGIRCAADPS